MLKKLLLVNLLMFGTFETFAQKVVSQTGGAAPTTGTVACGNSQAPSTAVNSYYRAYTLNSSMNITSVRVGIGSVSGSVPITVKLHKSNGAFPGSYSSGLTQIGSASYTLTATSTAMTVDVPFSKPVSVASGDIIVVEVTNIASTTAGNAYYMGVITGNETAIAYIRASECSIAVPTPFANVSPGSNGKIVIDLVENDPASSEDFFNTNFAVYPNPVTDVLNIESKNGLVSNEISILDITGKVLKSVSNTNSINVSDLAVGTYLINISTNEGQATSKFLKK